ARRLAGAGVVDPVGSGVAYVEVYERRVRVVADSAVAEAPHVVSQRGVVDARDAEVDGLTVLVARVLEIRVVAPAAHHAHGTAAEMLAHVGQERDQPRVDARALPGGGEQLGDRLDGAGRDLALLVEHYAAVARRVRRQIEVALLRYRLGVAVTIVIVVD